MPDYLEELEQLAKSLAALEKPSVVIPGTTVFTELATCLKHGEYERRTRKSDAVGRIQSHSACPDCTRDRMAEIEKLHAESARQQKKFNTERLMAQLAVPDRFSSATLANYLPENRDAARCLEVCQTYATRWPERLKQGGGLVICGKPGTGKNHLAFAIAKHVISEYQASVRFTSAIRIARNFKSTWSRTAEKTEAEVIAEYSSPDLLIIDEIGVQFGSDAEKMILFEIINNRYEDMKPTILISNLPKDELSAFIGERVIDRMNDGGGCTLVFTWNSYRSRAA